MNSFSRNFRAFDPSGQMDTILRSAEYAGRVPDAEYVALLFQSLLLRAPTAGEVGTWASNDRVDALNQIMDSAEASIVVNDDAFVRHLYEGMLGRPAGAAERASVLARLQADPRSTLWREFLRSEEFRLRELALRDRDRHGDEWIMRKFWFDY